MGNFLILFGSWARKSRAHSGQAAVAWGNSRSMERLSRKQGPRSPDKEIQGDFRSENFRPSTPRTVEHRVCETVGNPEIFWLGKWIYASVYL